MTIQPRLETGGASQGPGTAPLGVERTPGSKGVVLSIATAVSPKGKPPGVIHTSEIKGKKHKEKLPDLSESMREDWQRLLKLKSSESQL